MNQAVLFINNGKGGFTRGVLPFDDPRLIPSQVLFVDLDGDGLEELVGNRVLYRDGRGSIGLYTRKAGKWLFLPNAFEFNNPLDTRRSDAQPMTVGDVNGDGLLDVVIAGYENDQSKDPRTFNRVDARDGAETLLFINHGELRFEEESDARGIFGTRYTYVVGLFDFNADGDLDLFEGNDYGSNVLWDNQGDGTFRELDEHPLAGDSSNTMGLTIGDWDNSGRWSVYLSNMYSHAGQRVVNLAQSLGKEMQARLGLLAKGNQLFTQESTGKPWVETAVERKINAAGWAWASLFVDLDNDGDLDLIVSNASAMPAILYRNEGSSFFSDISFSIGIGPVTLPYFKWAIEFIDQDNDGFLDIFIANGHLQENISLFSDENYPQQDLLFWNQKGKKYVDISAEAGLAEMAKKVSRGMAFSDYDNDGDLDIFINNSNQSANLLRNKNGNKNNWITIKVRGTQSNRSGIGTRVKVITDDLSQTKEVRSGSSYLSQNDLRLLFGLDNYRKADHIEVRWPSGLKQKFSNIEANQILVIEEGIPADSLSQ